MRSRWCPWRPWSSRTAAAAWRWAAVAHKPWRVEGAESAMAHGGKAVTDRLLAGARPTSENAFKITLAQRTLSAVLAEAKKG